MSHENYEGFVQFDWTPTQNGHRHFYSNDGAEIPIFPPRTNDAQDNMSSISYLHRPDSPQSRYSAHPVPRLISELHHADAPTNFLKHERAGNYDSDPDCVHDCLASAHEGHVDRTYAYPIVPGKYHTLKGAQHPTRSSPIGPHHRSTWTREYLSRDWDGPSVHPSHSSEYGARPFHPHPEDAYRREYPVPEHNYPYFPGSGRRFDQMNAQPHPHRPYHPPPHYPPRHAHGHSDDPGVKPYVPYYPDHTSYYPPVSSTHYPPPFPQSTPGKYSPYSKKPYPHEQHPYLHDYPPMHRDIPDFCAHPDVMQNSVPGSVFQQAEPQQKGKPLKASKTLTTSNKSSIASAHISYSLYGTTSPVNSAVMQVDIVPSLLPNLEVRRAFLESQWALLRALLVTRFFLATGRPEVSVLSVANLKSAIAYFNLPFPFLSSTIVSKAHSYVVRPSSNSKRKEEAAQNNRTESAFDLEPLPDVDLAYIPHVPHASVPHPLVWRPGSAYEPDAMLTLPTSYLNHPSLLNWSSENLTKKALGWWTTVDTNGKTDPAKELGLGGSIYFGIESEFETDILMSNRSPMDSAKDPEQALVASTVGIFSAQIISLRRWKSKLCLAWIRSKGKCPRDKDCDFAHGTEEIRSAGGVPKSDKYKRRLCRVWLDTCGAFCMHGDHCCFAHGVHELRMLDSKVQADSLATHSADSPIIGGYDSTLDGGQSFYQDYERNLMNGMETLGLGTSLGLNNLRHSSIISTGSANNTPAGGTPTATKFKPALCRVWLEGIAKAAAAAAVRSLKINPDLTMSLISEVTEAASNTCSHGKLCPYAHGCAELRLPTHPEQVQVLTALLSEPYNEAIIQDNVDDGACTSRELFLLLIASGLLVGGLSPAHQFMIASAIHSAPTLFATEGDTVNLDEDDALGLLSRTPPTKDAPGLGLRHISPVFHGLPHAISMALTAAMRSPTLLLLVPNLLSPPSPSTKAPKQSSKTPSPMSSMQNSIMSTNSTLQTNSWSSDNNFSEQLQVQRQALSRVISTIGFDAADVCIAFAAIAIGFVKVPVQPKIRKFARKIIQTAIPIGAGEHEGNAHKSKKDNSSSPFTPGTTGRYAVFLKRAKAAFANESI